MSYYYYVILTLRYYFDILTKYVCFLDKESSHIDFSHFAVKFCIRKYIRHNKNYRAASHYRNL